MASFQTDLRAGPLDLDTSEHKIVTNIMLIALISKITKSESGQSVHVYSHRQLVTKVDFFSAGNRKFESLSVIWNLTEEMMMRFSYEKEEKEKIVLRHCDLWSCLVTWCVHRDCTLELGDVWETLLIHHIILFYLVHMLRLHAGRPYPSETHISYHSTLLYLVYLETQN